MSKVIIRRLKSDKFYAQYEIGPFEQGYGSSVAVPIRRVLVSKIKGTALTQVKIKGVDHEFSTIPGVKDDVLKVIMNLRKVVFRMDGSDREVVKLKIKGVGEVKASDFVVPSNVQVMNPEFVITEITDKKSSLELEAVLETGYGFVLRDDELRNQEPGVISLNKSFSPVLKVDYDIKSARVGQDTSYEKIVMEVWTNGAVTPDEALVESIDKVISKFAELREASANIE